MSQNREPSPSEAIMDSQTVETGTMVSKDVGFDSGKKIKGRLTKAAIAALHQGQSPAPSRHCSIALKSVALILHSK